MPIRILLADDHSVVRQGLHMFLSLDPELEVVGEAANGAEAVHLAEELKPDVVLMDLMMPVMSGLEATAAIRDKGLPTRVIVLTSVLENSAVTAVIRAGAIGYLLKDTEADDLRRAIKAATAGRAQLSPQIAARLLAETRAQDSFETLTDRESEVLRLAAQGLSDQEIAARLVVSEPVVHSYIGDILDKLRLANQAQAALLDFSNQLLDRPDPVALTNYLVQEIPRLLHVDACALLLPGSEPGYLNFRAASGWHRDPVAECTRLPFDEGNGPGWVMRSRQPWQAEDLTRVDSASWASDCWRAEGFRGHALIPLLTEGRAIGVLALSSRQPRLLDDDEVRFLRLLANQAALIIEQTRLHQVELHQQDLEGDLAAARQIQLGLLPESCPRVTGWEFAAAYQAARLIGGDLYDFIEFPGAPAPTGGTPTGGTPTGGRRIGVLIADVSGKSTPAALFMAHSRAVIRATALGQPSPALTFSQANDLIQKDNQTSHFVSAFYAILDTGSGRLTYANAGHPRPLHWQATTGHFQELAGRGMVLGVSDRRVEYEERQIDLAPGDLLILYTDGISEAVNIDLELFGQARLLETVAAASSGSPQEVIEAILAAVQRFTGEAPQADDFTLVVVKRFAI
ncbi:MAG TPA: SpoIIE family protein phosphatase [Anaerolineae bacterium]|nr:SpoIIE family protein phosphatase [Anaerolineae bacterium]